MSPKAQAILNKMRELLRELENNSARATAHITEQMASLLVLLAEEAENQSERVEKQLIDLVGIAADQKRLAAKLDVQTERLVGLTVWLRGLTIGLLVLTLVLCLLELGGREFIQQIRLNPTQRAPHINQPVRDTQQSTNH